MKPYLKWLGSLAIAVPVLIIIATVLAWGTVYEARFGTAAVQRTVYQAWWFQLVLGFLAVNLAVAAWVRYPWKKTHLPFVLAHVGIILILVGGIIGGRVGIEGQLIIPEGQAERTLQLSKNVLSVQHPASETTQIFPVKFDTRAWVQEPNARFVVPIGPRTVELTVDRYFPDAHVDEEIAGGGSDAFPAVSLRLTHDLQTDTMWLLANDEERFGLGWGEAHVLFLAPETRAQLDQLLGKPKGAGHPRGVVTLLFPNDPHNHDIPVPMQLGRPINISDTSYTMTFKDYFPDFALTEHGLTSRSDEPNNPAVSFVLTGPEGTDAHLLFARHPDFALLHGRAHTIQADVSYQHGTRGSLPPQSIAIVQVSPDRLMAILTDAQAERTVLDRLDIGQRYTHASLPYQFEVLTYHPNATMTQHITNRSQEVRAEALHVVARLEDQTAQMWVWLRQPAALRVGNETLVIEHRPASRELPVTIKLSDFRKITYPGSQMAAGFESDVQLTDPQRGIILMRKINMNNPLKYRGYSFFQSSFIDGPVQTTVLSVRNDPGTPVVYTGFLIVIGGVVSMFVLRARGGKRKRATPTSRTSVRKA